MFFVNNFSNIWHNASNPNINHKHFAVLHHLKKKWKFFDEKWAQNDHLRQIFEKLFAKNMKGGSDQSEILFAGQLGCAEKKSGK